MARRSRQRSILDEPCYDYPDCICGENCEHWWRVLMEWKADPVPPPPEVVDRARTCLIFNLACISHNCADPRDRRWAWDELMHPYFFGEWMRIQRNDPSRRRH
jgi:hypothetical protein